MNYRLNVKPLSTNEMAEKLTNLTKVRISLTPTCSVKTCPTAPTSYTLQPCICLVAQGRKQVTLGEDKPYLGVILKLDLREISQLLVDSELSFHHTREVHKGIALGRLTANLIDAFNRLITLLNKSANIKIMVP